MERRTITLTIEIDVEVECRYRESRPAPVCFGDHDSAGFSDPGDVPDISLMAVRVKDTNILPDMDDDMKVDISDRTLRFLENQI